MRVALLSHNACARDAVGNHVAETVAFFQERGADVRVFVDSTDRLHPEVCGCTEAVDHVVADGPVWEYLAGADLVIAQFSQAAAILDYLPLLAGGRPRLLLDYHSVTPPELWSGPNRAALAAGMRQRGLVWCVDAAITHSEFARRELHTATGFPAERIHVVPLVVDAVRFQSSTERWLQRRLGRDDIAIMLYVGRLAPNKRVPTLVEALVHLPSHVHAVVIGDTGDVYALEAEQCRQRAIEIGVADRLHVLGQVSDDELTAAYRSADMLVMPSRHEGFCVPVIEAMASGLPVLAARSAALPETVGDAGLTFTPDDAGDLARQVERMLGNGRAEPRKGPVYEPTGALRSAARPGRIAIACFRFGTEIVGGAEQSLRTIATTLQGAGYTVEVFTTCTRSDSAWRNELPSGTHDCDGLTVHRFPIDAHDRAAHLEAVRTIVDAAAPVTPEVQESYLRHSIHATALVQALAERADDFDAIITGPYLFGLTCDVARAFPERTLVVPCFHDELLARLAIWPTVYGRVGGMLLHSPEEQTLTLGQLGVNHPNVVEIGTWLETADKNLAMSARGDYVVYCGRYSAQKNVPLLLEWMRRYQQERAGRLRLVCMGQGEVPLPRATWLDDLGRVDEARKRSVLGGARALIQLSQQESLSLVALEAWAQGTPVIAHAGCAVLAGQVQRAQGGIAVADYDAFAVALDELWERPDIGTACGRRGRAFVTAHYGSRPAFLARLEQAIANLHLPLRERMQRRGLERARGWQRSAFRATFAGVVDELLHGAPRPYRQAIDVQPLQNALYAKDGTRTTLIAVRVHNRGTHAVAAAGPGRTLLHAEVRDRHDSAIRVSETTELPCLLTPGTTQTATALVPVPPMPGSYELHLRAGNCDATTLTLEVGTAAHATPLEPLLASVRELLTDARRGRRLPESYVDVTQGWFASIKRWVKAKLLHNFKHAYVDVLSRQQSQVNEQLAAAVEQLSECCAALDHTVNTLQQRLDVLTPRDACPVETERSHA